MGRGKRADSAGRIYHMLNRANGRATIFHKPAAKKSTVMVKLENARVGEVRA